MNNSIKFVATAMVLIITVIWGIYMMGRNWINTYPTWVASQPSKGAAASTIEASETVKTSTGDLTISSKVDEAKLGVPIYPGADKQGSGALVLSDAGSGSEEIAGARFTTPDAFDKVLQFYKSQVKPQAHIDQSDNEKESRAVLSLSSTDGQETLGIYITRKKESAKTEIAIHKGTARPGLPATRTN